MTQKIRVPDEKLGLLLRREQELNRRILEGTLDIDLVLSDLQKLIEGKSFNSDILQIFSDPSLSERINLGRYGYVNNDVTEKNFPEKVEYGYKVEYRIFHFNRFISSKSVIAEMEKEGFKPSNILELLRLGEIKPHLQKEFPIAALGSLWCVAGSHHCVPFLNFGDGKRELNLISFGNDWRGSFRFLGVRQVA